MVVYDSSYLIQDLQKKCKELKISYAGKKADLIKRLNEHFKNKQNSPEPNELSSQSDEEDDEDIFVTVPILNIQPPIEPNESGEDDERIATVRTKRNPVVYQFYKPTKEFNPVF